MKGHKRSNLKEHYMKNWDYIKESKKFIYLSIGIFLFFALIGFFVQVPDEMSLKIYEYIRNIVKQTEGLSAGGMVWFIFLNNLSSSFLSMVSGFALGIIPSISLVANGYLVGFVSVLSVESSGWLSLLDLLPHGVFELPAIFISLGLGLRLGTFLFQKNISESFRRYFWESLRVFFFIILPLLVIAAVIEGLLIVYV